MPRPSKNTDTKPAVAETVPAPAVVAQEPVATETAAPAARKGGRRAQASPAPETVAAAPPVAAAPTPTEPVAEAEPSNEDSEPKTRVAPTRESAMADFSEIMNLIETEIERLRESGDKAHSAKFLRQIFRRLRTLQSTTARVMRHKAPSARRNNNSGFLKPVNISTDMAKFTGLDAKTQHSRVDVTKFLCKYIKDKNLQNPTDKRQILADPALAKLLNYDSKNGPLTYYHMQSLLKTHFSKTQ